MSLNRRPSFEWTLDKAEEVARGSIRLVNGTDATGIAEIMVAKDCCAWHAGAVFYKFEARCPCQPCRIKRGEYAQRA